MHVDLTPRLGGLAIFAGLISAITIFGELRNGVQQVFAGAIIIFFIGLKDDMISVSAFKKFFVQVLAAGIVMFNGDIRITDFQGVFGIYQLDPGASYIITFVTIIGLTNALNLIDGLNGLAGLIISIVSSTFGVYFYLYGGAYYYPYACLAFALLGGIIGFLRYNFRDAIIFMGDTGSLVCGFVISILAIQFIEMKAVPNSPAISIGVLLIPVLDTIRVFILRIYSGVSPFAPDRNHIHHRLSALGISHQGSVLLLGTLNLISIGIVIYFSKLSTTSLLIIIITYALVISIILEIISKQKINKLASENFK